MLASWTDRTLILQRFSPDSIIPSGPNPENQRTECLAHSRCSISICWVKEWETRHNEKKVIACGTRFFTGSLHTLFFRFFSFNPRPHFVDQKAEDGKDTTVGFKLHGLFIVVSRFKLNSARSQRPYKFHCWTLPASFYEASTSGTSVLKFNLFQKAVWEVICSKTESFFPLKILCQHKRVVRSRTEVLFNTWDIFSMNMFEIWIVQDGRHSGTEVWLY